MLKLILGNKIFAAQASFVCQRYQASTVGQYGAGKLG